jgi:hypothetical protein
MGTNVCHYSLIIQPDFPLDRLVFGSLIFLAGLLIVIFHRAVKEHRDHLNALGWPIGYGEGWTGKYSRGGLIFTYATIIVAGLLLMFVGANMIMSAVVR